MPTFRSYTQAGGDLVNSFSLNRPAGVVSGDLLIAHVVWQTYNSPNAPAWTLPQGWTQERQDTSYQGTYVRGHAIFYKIAGASEPSGYTFIPDRAVYFGASCLAYSSPIAAAPIAASAVATTSSSSVTAPTVSATGTPLCLFSAPGDSSGTWSLSGGAARYTANGAGPYRELAAEDGANGATGTLSSGGSDLLATTLILAANRSPNAPTLTSPADNATIDKDSTQRFAWQFSDPDPGDSQSQAQLAYYPLDANGNRGTGTGLTFDTPNTFHDFPAGTFAAGDYEWQVSTYDALGEQSPWSATGFFTAATPTGVPTITSPTSGGTVGTSTATVSWSTAGGQQGYQVRRVADDGSGNPDTATVYYDTGQVTSTTTRSASVPFETNGRYEHIQVRVTADGSLWSSWASIRVLVSYTPPTVPTLNLSADSTSGSLLVSITNPAPGTGEPATSYNDVYVDDGDGEERKATFLPTNQPWRYWTPRAGVDYSGRVRVVAVGSNGTTSST